MMKVFSKCSVVLFGLMLFFGNNDSCYGMKEKDYSKEINNDIFESNDEMFVPNDAGGKAGGKTLENFKGICVAVFLFSLVTPEHDLVMKQNPECTNIVLCFSVFVLRRLIFGGALGHNIYKKMGNGNFHIYTSNLPSFLKFMHTGISYKINKRVYFNLIEFNLISFIWCGIVGQAVSCPSPSPIIFKFCGVTILEKILAFIFLLKRGCHFLTLSINIARYFCLNIELLGFFVDYLINKLVFNKKMQQKPQITVGNFEERMYIKEKKNI